MNEETAAYRAQLQRLVEGYDEIIPALAAPPSVGAEMIEKFRQHRREAMDRIASIDCGLVKVERVA